jgi:hypothetical protein
MNKMNKLFEAVSVEEILKWMTKSGYDRKASQEIAPIIYKYIQTTVPALVEQMLIDAEKKAMEIANVYSCDEDEGIDEIIKEHFISGVVTVMAALKKQMNEKFEEETK